MMNRLIIIVVIALLIFSFLSCGVRKVNKSSTDISVTNTELVKDTTTIKNDIKETIVDTSSQYEECYEPIDTSKVMVIDGKKFKNIRFKKIKLNKHINISKTDKSVSNKGKTTKKDDVLNIKEDNKDIDRHSFNYWWILIVAIILIIIYEIRYGK